jgi:hypothetical protein
VRTLAYMKQLFQTSDGLRPVGSLFPNLTLKTVMDLRQVGIADELVG